jgi:hypothetical protein
MYEYRRRLGVALAALPREEVQDLLDEVESHLNQAAADGRLEAYLVQMGEPEAFAAGILTERGLLPEGDLVPEAPRWRRGLAWLIDVAVSTSPLVLSLVISLFAFVPVGEASRWTLWAGFVVAVGVPAGWAWWYWHSRSRRGGRSSAGMTLTGLRPVRAGRQVRLVRRSSVPGERVSVRRVAWSLVLLGVASYLLVPLLYELVSFPGRQDQQRVEGAVRASSADVGAAIFTVTNFGNALLEGASEQDLLTLATPEALEDAAPLRYRARTGELGPLQPFSSYPPEYGPAEEGLDMADASIVIDAMERQGPLRSLRFTVQKSGVIERARQGSSEVVSYSPHYRIVNIQSVP